MLRVCNNNNNKTRIPLRIRKLHRFPKTFDLSKFDLSIMQMFEEMYKKKKKNQYTNG